VPEQTAARLATLGRPRRAAGELGLFHKAMLTLRSLTKFLLVARSLVVLILLWSAILAGTYNAKTLGKELGTAINEFLSSVWL
jgi:hypothetical protein